MPIDLTHTLRRLIRNIPLRWVLTVPFALPTIGAVALVGYLSYRNGQAAVEDLGHQLVAETNQWVMQELKTYLQTPLLINRLNVDAVNQKQLDLQNVPAIESTLFNRLQQFDQVSAVLFATPQGTFRLVDRLPDLYLVSADSPHTNQILVYRLDNQGKRGQRVTTLKGLDVRHDRPWYQRAVTTGEPGWSPISQYGSLELLTLEAFQPVYDHAKNRLLGVFAVHVRLDYLSEFLRGLDVSRFGRVIITDQNGGLIATSTGEKLYKFGTGTGYHRQFQQLKMYESQDHLTRSLGEYWRNQIGTSQFLDQIDHLDFWYNGELHYVKITPFQDQYGLNWRIITVVPKSHFLEAVQIHTQQTLLLCLLTLGVAIALGLLAAHQLTARFGQFNRVSRELTAGNLDQRLTVDSLIYELNELSQTFNQMADKAAELALQQSEARYRAIVEDQTELIVRFLPDTTLLFVNDAYCRYFGITQEEVIGKSYNPNIYEADRDQVAQRLQSLSIANPTVVVENRIVVDGDIRWTQWVNRLLFDDQENVAEIQAVGRDITALKRIEEALRKSEANLLQAQRIAHMGSWEFDLKTQKITWSEELFRIFGLDPTLLEPSYAELLEHIPTEDQRLLAAAVDQSIAADVPYEVEHRICRPDGTLRYVISKGQAVLNERQQVFQLCGTVLDITDRKATEIVLQQYERIVSATTDAISLVDRQYRYQIVNQAYLDWHNKTYDEMIGRSISDLVGLEVFETIIQPHLDRCFAGETVQYSDWFDFPTLGQQFVSVTYSPYLELDQTISGAVVSVRNITSLKQAEIALRESEERFQEIAQTLNQVSYVISVPTGQYLYISPAYEKLWGYSCESLYRDPKSWLDRIHSEDLEYVLQGLNQLFSGKQKRLQYRIFSSDGEIRWIESDSLIVHDEDGNPLRIVGLADDITDRRQAEAALQEREAMLRAIGDNLPKGFIYQRVYEPGKGFYYSYVSAGVERLLGLKPEAVLENPRITRSVGFAEELARADQIAQESLKNLTPIELQMRHRTAQGDIQWSSIRSTPRRLDDGRTVWDGVEVDITDLKRAEAALRASEEQFRRAFDDAPIGVSLVTMSGRFVKVNPRYCDLMEYTEAELLKLTFQEITHPDDLDKDLEGVQQMLAGKIDSFQLEKRYITKQGNVVPVLMNAALIRDQDGQPLYSVGHVQDIRDRLKVEQMKDEFISVVSHELRTPLTSIRGALGMLGSGVFANRPERASQMLQIAIDNSNRLVRLVDDILSLERLKSDKVQLVREECQVTDLMQQAIDSVQSLADQAGITLSCTPLAAALYADPDAIVQTLTNLLSNAIKFSSIGDTVWLKAELEEVGKVKPDPLRSPHILFTVKDQGRGVPKDKLEVIFEQFQQVDVSDSRKKGGTGLGLAICKKIVQQHCGQIWVESGLGQGSTFYFTLPAHGRQNND